MKGFRGKINDRQFAKLRKTRNQEAAEALERNLSHIAGEIVASSATPSEAVEACQIVAQAHSLGEEHTWRLIEKVMAFFHEKCGREIVP
ncbi:hypothetical protein [Magnetospirillum sp. 64-120]|mgnify:CR=1 FL=1|uniref:hypothetical protein n=1 Tax=Magnetospirillum sp. 64-120 TaxID=1895778 RepID=UPI0009283446|nr:hypothetical protein [Magnetospirillum sp. 64-120]OJX79939.1 MAG: hypothetical protein BGO92_03250 [Magnetospirillum sp. 64-120]